MGRQAAILGLIVSAVVVIAGQRASADIAVSGYLDPDQDSWWTAGGDPQVYATVGNSALGEGTVLVDGGSQLASWWAAIGSWQAAATGTVTVSGSGSAWTTHGGNFLVGSEGHGTLNIMQGGRVSTATGIISVQPGSEGYVKVDGPDSTWSMTGSLWVGSQGTGSLSILDRGAVSSGDCYIGRYAGAKGYVYVDGYTSKWTTGHLRVGDYGGGLVGIWQGAAVTSTSSFIGSASGASGHVAVCGATWTIDGPLYVSGNPWGGNGRGYLEIWVYATVTNADAYIASQPDCLGFDWGLVEVHGTGATWNNTGSVYVGHAGPPGGRDACISIGSGGLVMVGGVLQVYDDGYVLMDAGAMLALAGDWDASLATFLAQVAGNSSRVCYWHNGSWQSLSGAGPGAYMLAYQDSGDLSGYTVLTVVPEPATLALLALGGLAALVRRRRR